MAWGSLGTIDAGRQRRWKSETIYGLGAVLAVALAALLGATPRSPEPAPAGSAAGGLELPLSFVPNAGQHDAQVRYAARGPGYSFFFTKDIAALTLVRDNRGTALNLRFVGASPKARLVPGERGAGRVNYLRGSKRDANLPIYESLTYRDLWPGIDMTFRGQGGALKYEFRVAPGANPSAIRLAYEGSEALSVAPSGALAVRTSTGTLADSAPRSYQRSGARHVPVDSRFAIHGKRSYGFEVGAYERDRPLVIDPSLAYSTYLGEGASVGSDIAVDAEGNAYVVGDVFGCCTTHPTTPGAFDTTRNGADEAWVAKFDPSGSQLVYSTFLGGAPGHGAGIAVDDQGHAYVTGYGVVPTTPGAYSAGTNPRVFITKLNQDGSAPIYSARFGGLFDRGVGIAIDEFGNAYVAGVAGQGFPTTPGAFDTTGNDSADPFALKLNATGTAPVYSTYLGGNGFEETAGIDVDRLGQAYVAGYTQSPNFPTTPGAHDETLGGQRDGFVTKLNPLGSELVYSTFLGGPNLENMRGIAVDSDGSAYATGYAFSHTSGPTRFPRRRVRTTASAPTTLPRTSRSSPRRGRSSRIRPACRTRPARTSRSMPVGGRTSRGKPSLISPRPRTRSTEPSTEESTLT